MLTTIPQSSSSVSANGGSVMPSWHYGNGSVSMGISSPANSLMCNGMNSTQTNVNALGVGNNSTARLIGMSNSGGSIASTNSSAASSLGPPPELLNLNRQVKCEFSPTNMYGGNNCSTPDLEPETRARANTWHAERKRPDRQMLESLLEEDDDDDDDSPEDSLSGLKPESLSPLGDSNLMGGSPGSVSGHGSNSKKISRRNAWGNLSYADLITKAIECSPEKRLTLSQIYDWMVQNIPYFKDKGDTTSSAGWKNSIRHNLSLHTRFMRLQNESSGKSSWWVINPDASKSGKSPRRRAASIDTKNFERKRGRVKKRLQALQGSTSTDFGSALGSRNVSSSSINSASGDNTGNHDYRPMHFGSSTTALESRLQHLAASADPCWGDTTSGTGSSAFDMDLDSPTKNQSDSYHQQLFGASQVGARSSNSSAVAAYGNHQQQQGQAAGAASTPPHLPTTYLHLQGSYHLAAVPNTPNSHHHHGSPGSAAAPATMGTFHAFHSSPFGQHPTAAVSSYNMPSYHLQSMSYNGNHGGDNLFQTGAAPGSSPQMKSYSNLQPVAMLNNQPFKQQPTYGAPSHHQQQQQQQQQQQSSNGGGGGLMGTVHHHHQSSNHNQPSQLNQQQQLLSIGAGNNSAGMSSTPPGNNSLPQDLDFFEPFVGSGMNGGSSSGLLGLSGNSSVGNASSYFVDIADMDSTIGKDLCADSSLDVNLEFESLLSTSQLS